MVKQLPLIFFMGILFFLHSEAKNIYIDNTLKLDCFGTYSIAKRNNTGSDGIAYSNPQKAADAAQPGDIVLFREGRYLNAGNSKRNVPVISIIKSGTKNKPITFKNYNDEIVIISGADSSVNSSKFNAISLGIKPSDQKDSSGFGVQNIIIEGLIIEGATYYGIGVFGPANRISKVTNPTSNITLRKIIARNNKGANNLGSGIRTTGKVVNIVIEYCEAYNNTGGGIGFGRLSKTWHTSEPDTNMSAAQYCIVRNCLTYRNINPENPGNTDGLSGSNIYRCSFENNISFDNSDDGMDIYSSFETTISGNIIFGHNHSGGNNTGIKFSAGGGGKHMVASNIVANNRSYSFECSTPTNPLRDYYPNKIFNNIAFKGSRGYNIGTGFKTIPGFEKTILNNNVALYNLKDISGESEEWLNSDFNYISDPEVLSNLQAEGHDRHSIKSNLNIPQTISIDTVFNPNWTIEEKIEHIRSQVRTIFKLREGNVLIDAGTIIKGFHNPKPGDSTIKNLNPWYGKAPDIGPFEFKSY